jgi:hypothetical protein
VPLTVRPRAEDDGSIMRKPVIAYVESSVPEYMTLADYRRSRPRRAPKRVFRGFFLPGPRAV